MTSHFILHIHTDQGYLSFESQDVFTQKLNEIVFHWFANFKLFYILLPELFLKKVIQSCSFIIVLNVDLYVILLLYEVQVWNHSTDVVAFQPMKMPKINANRRCNYAHPISMILPLKRRIGIYIQISYETGGKNGL